MDRFRGIWWNLIRLGWWTPLGSLRPTTSSNAAHFRPELEFLEGRALPSGAHIHVQLTILVNGQTQVIPANLGIGPRGEMESIHTHDTTGRLHMHPTAARDFMLQEFFTSWGQPSSRREFLGYLADSSHPVTLTVNGTANETLGAYVLRDGDALVLRTDQAVASRDIVAAAQAITHSAESYGYFVSQCYQHYLGRNPDPEGLVFWVTQMQQGLTQQRLEASFLSSPEYWTSHGGTSTAWVQALYHDLLERAPDEAGLNAWLAQMNAGTPAYEVALGLAASLERAAMQIREDYFTYLGRAASEEDVNYWTGRFRDGATNETLVAGFVASSEYYYKAAKGNGSPADWIHSLYRNVLHRPAAAAEVSAWLGILGRM